MSSEEKVTITLTTADRAKKAQVTVPSNLTVAALVEACKKNWMLPATEDFAVRDPKKNVQLNSKETLTAAGIGNGTELEVYPLLEAGFRR